MCGIAGLINISDLDSSHYVKKMISEIRYRGIDEQGVKDFGDVVMGHARLAVVDPENGHQPMSNTDETVWVTFNGEIYNYVEIREELKSKGYQFKSRCDTEVLVHLWREEGEDMLDRLIGMFSFCIWDSKQKKGMLVRDRQGIKPLYIAAYKKGIAFASEIKAILSLPDFDAVIDDSEFIHLFSFGSNPLPNTFLKGIRHLDPGTKLIFGANGSKIKEEKYWQWPLAGERETPTFDELTHLLKDAIRMQMRFDVKGALLLSGGVDSSIVAEHLLPQWNEGSLTAYALDVQGEQFGEYKYSKFVADRLGIHLNLVNIHHTMIPDMSAKIVFHSEQPHGDFSFFLIYKLCEAAHNDGKIVVFTGDGPDEPLLGFSKATQFMNSVGRTNFSMQQYFNFFRYTNDEISSRLLNPDFNNFGKDYSLNKYKEFTGEDLGLEPCEQIAAFDMTCLMPSNNFVKADRMAAGLSIEGRSPFLDHRVSEMLCRLPSHEKYQNGIGKKYLKQYALKYFPEEFIFRPKTMPIAPVGEWIKGPLYGWAYETLDQVDPTYFNREAILDALKDHQEGKQNYYNPLRTILMAQLWKQNFLSKYNR